MEVLMFKLKDQAARRILNVGSKVGVELTEAGAQAKGRELIKQIKAAAQQGDEETFEYVHQVAGSKKNKIGFFLSLRLKFNHFINKSLGRYKAATETAEDVAEEAGEQAGRTVAKTGTEVTEQSGKVAIEVVEQAIEPLFKKDIVGLIDESIAGWERAALKHADQPEVMLKINTRIKLLRELKKVKASKLIEDSAIVARRQKYQELGLTPGNLKTRLPELWSPDQSDFLRDLIEVSLKTTYI